ncbi:MAG: uroporphyrinogen-III C-methyltransferase [Chloroflexi bacterium]|nr:uroporphyrinogen-III C-methyltransferase [Chloroflexota bacterium]
MSAGIVYLVGAGPGDPGLITVAGLDRIREADVIVYDRLISERLLDYARADAELIYVGKVPGQVSGADVSHDQDAINQILADKAREGRRVVRLKGGDPFVFGRGGEEAEALRAAGIPFEIVPGITSAVAVPAYAGIPVTHRGVAASFAVITGHEEPGKPQSAVDWSHLAAAVDTLVFLMGVKNLPEIVTNLVANGRPETTPVAVIRWGTTPEQSTVTGTLADIAERVAEAGLTPPAITVVGEVVRLRENLSWFEDRPLFGKRVLITRTRRQASELARLLAAQGALPIELPAIEIEPVADTVPLAAAIDRLRDGGYAWCGFTSANAVELTFEHLAERGFDARSFGGTRVFAIGPATADALRSHGITADVVPDEYVAEAVVEAMRPHVSEGDGVLLPRAESARAELVTGLEALGATVDEITVYRAAVPSGPDPKVLAAIREGRIDIVTFTSSSTVRNLLAILGSDAAALKGESRPLIACIGPITADTARENGLTVDVMASEYTVEGLVEALAAHLTGQKVTS